MRLMAIDDHLLVLDSMRTLLEAAIPGCEIVAFDDAEKALVALDVGERFDMVLIDLLMAPLSGIGFLRELSRRKHDLKVLVVSGDTDPGRAETALKLGASAVVSKAEGAESLVEAVKALAEAEPAP